ncbi:MAG: hypothetical protein ACREF3_15445 [Acetobacteraceae bacterium]
MNDVTLPISVTLKDPDAPLRLHAKVDYASRWRLRKFRRLLLPVVPNPAKSSLPICVQTPLPPLSLPPCHPLESNGSFSDPRPA